jgi:hypothetical protein
LDISVYAFRWFLHGTTQAASRQASPHGPIGNMTITICGTASRNQQIPYHHVRDKQCAQTVIGNGQSILFDGSARRTRLLGESVLGASPDTLFGAIGRISKRKFKRRMVSAPCGTRRSRSRFGVEQKYSLPGMDLACRRECVRTCPMNVIRFAA